MGPCPQSSQAGSPERTARSAGPAEYARVSGRPAGPGARTRTRQRVDALVARPVGPELQRH
eukprot:2614644-Alexandrium_andersonii.AAC.1